MDLHPEDLIEREMCGELSPAERERLEVHARQCAACRLERMARTDFRREAESPEAETDVQRLLSTVAAPLAMQWVPTRSRIGSARMRHLRFVLVSAAVISVTGIAAAARWSGTLARIATVAPAAPVAAAPLVQGTVAPRHRAGRAVDAPVPEVASPDPVAPVVDVQGSNVPVAGVATPDPIVPVVVAPPVAARAPSQAIAAAPVARATVLAPPSSPELDAPPVAPVDAAPDAPTIFRRANAARQMGDHARAGELYRQLLDGFATSPEARASLAMFGRMLLDDGNASGALRRFDDALRVGPGALREDVMLGRALALQRLGRVDDEAKAWSSLLSAYPSSVHSERARRRLRELGRS